MAKSRPTTVEEYLATLPAERREALGAVRQAIHRRLPKGYAEGMQYGMIAWFVPHAVYPPGYHCDPRQPLPFAGLAHRKGHMSLHLMGLYMDEARRAKFEAAWKKTGKRFDMGKACVRFRRLEDVPLEVVTDAIASMPVEAYVRRYEAAIPPGRRRT